MKTLFWNTDTTINGFLFMFSLKASREFIDCADKQLTEQFIKETGIEPSNDVCFALSQHFIGAPLYTNYLRSDNFVGRKLMIRLFVKNNWNPITILWESKTNRDYKLHDTDIDSDDIRFWFESLDKDLYLRKISEKNG